MTPKARVGRALRRLGNAVVGAILRSPAHRLLSSSVMLLTYTGRRTGRRHTIPVAYVEIEGDLVVFVGDAGRKVWWRNVRAPAPVELRLRGRTVAGHAEAVPDDEKLVALYRARHPRAAAVLTATPRTWVRIRPKGEPRAFCAPKAPERA